MNNSYSDLRPITNSPRESVR